MPHRRGLWRSSDSSPVVSPATTPPIVRCAAHEALVAHSPYPQHFAQLKHNCQATGCFAFLEPQAVHFKKNTSYRNKTYISYRDESFQHTSFFRNTHTSYVHLELFFVLLNTAVRIGNEIILENILSTELTLHTSTSNSSQVVPVESSVTRRRRGSVIQSLPLHRNHRLPSIHFHIQDNPDTTNQSGRSPCRYRKHTSFNRLRLID